MATITATVLAAAGTGLSFIGQRQAARAAESTGFYNAALARQQAGQEQAVGAENARRKARENARMIAQQRAALAKSGLQMEGTPLAVLGETAMMLERDIMDMGFEAENRLRNLLAGADLSVWEGKQQRKAGMLGSVGTAIGGLAGTTEGYAKAKGLWGAPRNSKDQ